MKLRICISHLTKSFFLILLFLSYIAVGDDVDFLINDGTLILSASISGNKDIKKTLKVISKRTELAKQIEAINLSYKKMNEIPWKELSRFPNLKVLILDNNNIRSVGNPGRFPKMASKISKIELKNNKGLRVIRGLKSLINLKWLGLGCTRSSLVSKLPELPLLEQLFLYSNGISDVSSLQSYPSLWQLDLDNNIISLETLQEVNPQLKILQLRNNGLTSTVGFPQELRAIKILWLNQNPLRDLRGISACLSSLETLLLEGDEVPDCEKNHIRDSAINLKNEI